FVGDAIAAVAAETLQIAEYAASLIEVEYEELPAVFDALDAMSDAAPVLHPERTSYQGAPELPPIPNLQGYNVLGKGDISQGFAEAELVFEHTFSTPASHQGYIEPRACVVDVSPAGRMRIWSSCQSPYALRDALARLFNRPSEEVVVEATPVGGSFGAKGSVGPEAIVCLLARRAGRPVKFAPSNAEELVAGNPRHPSSITLKTGVKRDGTLVAREARIVMDGGAYGAYKPTANVILPSTTRALGPYRIAHTRIESLFVYTNNIPGGVARAPAQPQVVFAGESQMDLIAHELGLDPVEFRLRNIIEEGDVWPHNGKFEGVMTRQVLELLRDRSDWSTPLGPFRGRGMAMTERPINAGASGLTVTLHDDGTATALTGIADCGTGAHTIMRQILAEELHLPYDAIDIEIGNTDEALFDAGMGGSKHTFSLTVSAVNTSGQLMAQLRDVAAEQLECSTDDLELVGESFQVRGHAGLNVRVQEVAAKAASRAGGSLAAESSGPGRDDRAPQSCIVAYAAEVEVDPETGQITPITLTAVHDVGRAINPQLLQAQIDGGTIQGLGQALMEDLGRADGRVLATNLGDYKLPTSADIPRLVSAFVEDAPGPGPYAAKAVGELSNVTVPAALANAVARACGARVMDLPLTAERILAAIQGSHQQPD
ncbi:MAG TPA: xanthine dehydrogenase family protein molybdopterin-binding subunit, partial [Chloroflexota bacterium]|nr:xanthine dehydrogenase family protein molybdopterin-binding subunit [Chloroflexota bacterium]